MAIYQSALLGHFTCVGDRCEDTCCKGWCMQVDSARIEKFQAEAPVLMDAVDKLEGSASKNAAYSMRQNPETGFCVKFDDGWCGIHRDYGSEFLSDACHFYPRIPRGFGGDTYFAATLSCPEITRLAVVEGKSTSYLEVSLARSPQTVSNYLPDGMESHQALAVMQAFLDTATNEALLPEQALARMVSVSRALVKLPQSSWVEAVPFYLRTAGERVLPAERDEMDAFKLMTALAGIMTVVPAVYRPRLESIFSAMESAFEVSYDWKSQQLTHAADLDPHHRYKEMVRVWKREHRMSRYLRRWLAMQLSMSSYPFAGLGADAAERMTIIAVRYSLLRLALTSARYVQGSALSEKTLVTTMQTLSRALDHLADPELLRAVCAETGWARERRLMGLLEV